MSPQTIAACGRGRHGIELRSLHWLEATRGRARGRRARVVRLVRGVSRKAASRGAVDSFEPCLIAPHGGDLDGFILVRGERSKLSTMRFSEEFEELVSKCLVSVDGFGVVEAYVGESVTTQLQRYAKNIRR